MSLPLSTLLLATPFGQQVQRGRLATCGAVAPATSAAKNSFSAASSAAAAENVSSAVRGALEISAERIRAAPIAEKMSAGGGSLAGALPASGRLTATPTGGSLFSPSPAGGMFASVPSPTNGGLFEGVNSASGGLFGLSAAPTIGGMFGGSIFSTPISGLFHGEACRLHAEACSVSRPAKVARCSAAHCSPVSCLRRRPAEACSLTGE